MARPRKENSTESGKYIAKMAFKDAREHQEGSEPKSYEVGEDVSHFDQERLNNAIAWGIVEFTGNSNDAESEA